MIRRYFSLALRVCWRFAFIAILTPLLGVPVEAQTRDGGGVAGGSVNWTNGINWVGDVAPASTQTATISGNLGSVAVGGDITFDVDVAGSQ